MLFYIRFHGQSPYLIYSCVTPQFCSHGFGKHISNQHSRYLIHWCLGKTSCLDIAGWGMDGCQISRLVWTMEMFMAVLDDTGVLVLKVICLSTNKDVVKHTGSVSCMQMPRNQGDRASVGMILVLQTVIESIVRSPVLQSWYWNKTCIHL